MGNFEATNIIKQGKNAKRTTGSIFTHVHPPYKKKLTQEKSRGIIFGAIGIATILRNQLRKGISR